MSLEYLNANEYLYRFELCLLPSCHGRWGYIIYCHTWLGKCLFIMMVVCWCWADGLTHQYLSQILHNTNKLYAFRFIISWEVNRILPFSSRINKILKLSMYGKRWRHKKVKPNISLSVYTCLQFFKPSIYAKEDKYNHDVWYVLTK